MLRIKKSIINILSLFLQASLRKKANRYILDTEYIPSTSSTAEQEAIVSPHSVANKLDVTKLHKKSLKGSFRSIASFKDGGDISSRTINAIIYMICKDSQSVSLIEDEDFKHFAFNVGEKLKESVLVQYEKIFGRIESSHFFAKASLLDSRFKNLHLQDKALWGKWIRKLNNKIREEGESSDSDGRHLSPAPPSS
ncbi:hypothetical protein NPIL_123521 [Nephila pilipes]|uniref:Uncharacterized protein n=1 Tax=Nephila pilipes TaxID=299642 RepID=A0A8X6T4U3_NEPPI|nr:hypothetical protein NPIL_600091 [Nephila pilipes]GFU14158.1 hypothetical protein NPIL_123521 [Nephila pilipes]